MTKFETWMLKVFVACGVASLLVCLVAAPLALRAEAKCQSHGYVSAMWWPTVTYCIKRVNQTDVVVPLDSLEASNAR